MNHYTIRVKIEIVESEASCTPEPVAGASGGFEWTVDDATASGIDECEQALLAVNYPALRSALAAHLSAISQKK